MSLPHAILTALLEKPSSGLELTRRFDKSIGFFWAATHQQIYRELGKLEDAGLIRAIPGPPAQGRRKEYEVLPDGREELAAWVSRSDDPRPLRDPLALRLRAAAMVGVGDVGAEVRRHLAVHAAQLDAYRIMETRDFPDDQARQTAEATLQHLVLTAGIEMERFWTEWLTKVDAVVSELGDAGEADGKQ
ncbi:PadR family transcriptional regulator [Streptacidiphilus fuscans]|uniref:PadR family transcriptional regulator n=1 Tax=Streptacidiphilus fuscans TaxID=2789292 RepID=A0A931BAG4_9ACTN|nr:PadR family transcriptional regulator [Streptacidiphilus fuscans]MBF9073108.1 PadR family transcriptional regulator [Streptacidiphilus fuscans]